MFKKLNIRIGCGLLLVASTYTQANITPAEKRKVDFENAIEINADQPMTTAQKIVRLSATLLGAPYVDGNLGEGVQGKYDQDPLSRFDEFDCMTYVEVVLAGAISHTSIDFLPNLLRIRYKNGQVSFTSRNHFASTDWLPNNRWMLQDITQKIGGNATLSAKTVIDKRSWYQHLTLNRIKGAASEDQTKTTLLTMLKKEGEKFQPESVVTPYIPLSSVFQKNVMSSEEPLSLANSTINQALLDRIPTGSVISVVRPNYNIKRLIGTNINITHQAIAIRKNGRLYIRNASLLKGEVVDQEFVHYFSRYLESTSLKGFNVQQPTF